MEQFTTTVVGSLPRPKEVLVALREKKICRLSEQEFHKIADKAVIDYIHIQEKAEIDIISDREQRRDNFISFVSESLNNVKAITVSELLDYVEDKSAFEEILGTLDVPAYSLSNPAAFGKISRKKPIALNELEFLKKNTNKKVKIALPGPYLLMRSMWVEGLSSKEYPDRLSLAEDIVKVLKEELEDLIHAGADFVQFDEPVLTEVVFTRKNESRTFMCGALTSKADSETELELAVKLINRITDGMRGRGTRIGLHVCRGNWSTNESILLKGPYTPLMPYLKKMNVDQLVLEYSTSRAGSLESLSELSGVVPELGLGSVNPRIEEIESIEEIIQRVKEAQKYFENGTIFLNPDCGFGTFSQRPMNTLEVVSKKLIMLTKVRDILRDKI